MRWKLITLALLLPLARAQSIPAPQVPLTGTPGSGGAFAFLNAGTINLSSDANFTMTYPNFTGISITVTSSVELTATRNIIMPAGYFTQNYCNYTLGVQAIQVIGPTGTGVQIPNGGCQWVKFDGTNWVSGECTTGCGFAGTTTFSGNLFANINGGYNYVKYGCPSATSGCIDTLFGTLGSANPNSVIADPTYNSQSDWLFTGNGSPPGLIMPDSSNFLDFRGGQFSVVTNNPAPGKNSGGQVNYGTTFYCNMTKLIGDPVPTSGSMGYNYGCNNIVSQNIYPGWNYGSPGYYDVGSSVSNFLNYLDIDLGVGIHNGLTLTGDFPSAGDVNASQVFINVSSGWLAGSDEGDHVHRDQMSGSPSVVTTVSSGGLGATQVSLATNQGAFGLNRPMLDETAGVYTGTSTSGGSTSYGAGVLTPSWSYPTYAGGTTYGLYATVVYSGNLYTSLQASNTGNTPGSSPTFWVEATDGNGTLTSAANTPRVANNTTFNLVATSETFTVNTTRALAVGELLDIIPDNTGSGNPFQEVTRITAVGALSGGVQSVTAPLYYPHPSGSHVCAGGLVGSYVEFTAFTTASGERNVQNVFCSPTPTTLVFGHQVPNLVAAYYGGSAVKMYQGGETVGIIDPTYQSAGRITVMPNNAAWTASDTIEITNNISASYSATLYNENLYNPFALRTMNQINWAGYGGAAASSLSSTGAQYLSLVNSNACTGYVGCGGMFVAPDFEYLGGDWSGAIAMQYAPIFGSSYHCGLAGFIIAVCGIDPSSTQTTVGLFDLNSDSGNAYIQYSLAGHAWQVKNWGAVALTTGSIANTGVYQGPATAPSGSCTTVGWVFSQDGHATFCNGTTWISKI